MGGVVGEQAGGQIQGAAVDEDRTAQTRRTAAALKSVATAGFEAAEGEVFQRETAGVGHREGTECLFNWVRRCEIAGERQAVVAAGGDDGDVRLDDKSRPTVLVEDVLAECDGLIGVSEQRRIEDDRIGGLVGTESVDHRSARIVLSDRDRFAERQFAIAIVDGAIVERGDGESREQGAIFQHLCLSGLKRPPRIGPTPPDTQRTTEETKRELFKPIVENHETNRRLKERFERENSRKLFFR